MNVFDRKKKLFSPIFFNFPYNTVMIYNNKNWNNNTTESQKAKKDMFH